MRIYITHNNLVCKSNLQSELLVKTHGIQYVNTVDYHDLKMKMSRRLVLCN